MTTPINLADAAALRSLLNAVADWARSCGRFGEVRVTDAPMLVCAAKAAAAPAEYRVFAEGGLLWVSLVMADRYLSQSIEQDLVHTGDKMADLLHDELIDADHPNPAPIAVEHFRDPTKLFTFRSAVPRGELEAASEAVARNVFLLLKAYEACFSALGDMSAGEDDE